MIAVGDGVVRLRCAPARPRRVRSRAPADVRLLLHRTEHCPVVTLVVSTPAAIRTGQTATCLLALLDVGAEPDRNALTQLGRTLRPGRRRHRRSPLRQAD
jgi:hypothetical protein